MRLLLVLFLAGCSFSGFDKTRKIEYACENNGRLTMEWEDNDRKTEIKPQ